VLSKEYLDILMVLIILVFATKSEKVILWMDTMMLTMQETM